MVRLLAERSDTKSNVKLDGFRSQLQASYVCSHTEELWYNETVCLWMTTKLRCKHGFLWLSHYSYLSSIASGGSSRLHPVSVSKFFWSANTGTSVWRRLSKNVTYELVIASLNMCVYVRVYKYICMCVCTHDSVSLINDMSILMVCRRTVVTLFNP